MVPSWGVLTSLALAYAIFVVGTRINLRKFFYFTSILLVLLAGGLTGYGVHEVIEYSESTGVALGCPAGYAYVLDVPSDSLFHHNGAIGSIFAVMFGYTVKAEWARVIIHLTYLTIAIPLVVMVYRKR